MDNIIVAFDSFLQNVLSNTAEDERVKPSHAKGKNVFFNDTQLREILCDIWQCQLRFPLVLGVGVFLSRI